MLLWTLFVRIGSTSYIRIGKIKTTFYCTVVLLQRLYFYNLIPIYLPIAIATQVIKLIQSSIIWHSFRKCVLGRLTVVCSCLSFWHIDHIKQDIKSQNAMVTQAIYYFVCALLILLMEITAAFSIHKASFLSENENSST